MPRGPAHILLADFGGDEPDELFQALAPEAQLDKQSLIEAGVFDEIFFERAATLDIESPFHPISF